MGRNRPGDVLIEDRDAVRIVAISNPDQKNALDDGARRALLSALQDAMSSPSCRVVVLTGDGDTFCTGGELTSMPTTDLPAVHARLGEMHGIARALIQGPKPVIAAVEAFAYGSGMSLAAACDHVVASRDATFCASFRRVGLAPDTGLAWSLTRRVGASRARELVLFAEPIGASRATEIGLVDDLVDAGQARTRAIEKATTLGDAAPLALAAAKSLIRYPDDFDAFVQLELDQQTRLLASEDFVEGREAFFDRREPKFRGT